MENKKNKPVVETRIELSKDRKWVLHRTIITDIKPVAYFQTVLDNNTSTKEVSI